MLVQQISPKCKQVINESANTCLALQLKFTRTKARAQHYATALRCMQITCTFVSQAWSRQQRLQEQYFYIYTLIDNCVLVHVKTHLLSCNSSWPRLWKHTSERRMNFLRGSMIFLRPISTKMWPCNTEQIRFIFISTNPRWHPLISMNSKI